MKIIYLKLPKTSWERLLRVIRRRESGIWCGTCEAELQALEAQLTEVESGDAVALDSPFLDRNIKVVRSAITDEGP